jgi:hypothetical protein
MPLSSTTVDESVGAAVWPSAALTQTNCFNPSFGRWRLNTRHEKPQTRTPRGSALHLFSKPSTFEIADLTKRNSGRRCRPASGKFCLLRFILSFTPRSLSKLRTDNCPGRADQCGPAFHLLELQISEDSARVSRPQTVSPALVAARLGARRPYLACRLRLGYQQSMTGKARCIYLSRNVRPFWRAGQRVIGKARRDSLVSISVKRDGGAWRSMLLRNRSKSRARNRSASSDLNCMVSRAFRFRSSRCQ